MDSEEFMAVRSKFDQLCTTILEDKGLAYGREDQTAAQDRLGNFKRAAEDCGADPLQVCLIFMVKHVDSLCTWVTQMGTKRPDAFYPMAGGELIELRMADIRNYMDLMFALTIDRAKAAKASRDTSFPGAGTAGDLVDKFVSPPEEER